MIIIEHRVNTKKQLIQLPKFYGVEVDIRSYGKKLIINHEPFKESLTFQSWLKNFNHKFLIANIKEEGIEYTVLKLLKKFNIKNYFLLDVTVPQIIKLEKDNINALALRVSKYENFKGIANYKKFYKWLWIDTFDEKIPLKFNSIKQLKLLGHKICLVSPELGSPKIDLHKFCKKNFSTLKFIDAVCSKNTLFWNNYIKNFF